MAKKKQEPLKFEIERGDEMEVLLALNGEQQTIHQDNLSSYLLALLDARPKDV